MVLVLGSNHNLDYWSAVTAFMTYDFELFRDGMLCMRQWPLCGSWKHIPFPFHEREFFARFSDETHS